MMKVYRRYQRVTDTGIQMKSLVLLFLGVSSVYSDDHSLRIYETVVSSPVLGQPDYSVQVYLDEQLVATYNSNTRQYDLKFEWVNVEPESWAREERRNKIKRNILKLHLQEVMKNFKETEGVHFYQLMYGCQIRDDGSTKMYMQHGFDGEDYAYLDTQKGIYIPTKNEAQIATENWNSPQIRMGERQKHDMEINCLSYLKNFIDRRKKEMEKRVRPEVKVWGHSSEEETKLYCLVYGFQPRTVDVKWMRNGTDHIPPEEASPILPHPDGTYQIRISLEVPTREEDSYFCHVDHSSLEEILRVKWEPDNGRQSDVIVIVIGVIAGLAALAAVIAGVAFYIRLSRDSGGVGGESGDSDGVRDESGDSDGVRDESGGVGGKKCKKPTDDRVTNRKRDKKRTDY